MEMIKTINVIGVDKALILEDSGFLDGLTGELRNIVKNYILQVDDKRIKTHNTEQCVIPVIRRIIDLIYGVNKFHVFNRKPDMIYKVLNLIDLNDIIDELDNIYYTVLITMEKYLPEIDSQAELTSLFCDNYVFKLIKEVEMIK